MSVEDISIQVILSFIFVVILIPIIYAYNVVMAETTPIFGADSRAVAVMTGIQEAYSYLDYALVVSYISFLLGSLILAWFVRSHPVFFVFFMVGTLLLTFLSWIYKNVLVEFTEAMPEFQSIYAQFPITEAFIFNLPLLVLIASIVIGVIQYTNIFESDIDRRRISYG